jgi:hypothetical protein
MKTIAILAACLSLCSCASYQDKTGITPGQSLQLAGHLLDQYQGLRRANMTSAKTALVVVPEPEPGPVRKLSLWDQVRGAAGLLGF